MKCSKALKLLDGPAKSESGRDAFKFELSLESWHAHDLHWFVTFPDSHFSVGRVLSESC